MSALTPLQKHVALVGFMGSGKTTLGEEVARRIGRKLIDLDRVVENTANQSIAELFRDGESRFRELEAVAAGSLASPYPMVFALGGGAVTTEATRALLRAHSTPVSLA